MIPLTESKQPVDSADIDIFTFAPFFTNVSSVFLVSFFVACLAIVFPWNGGPMPGTVPFFFGIALASSLYSLSHGYAQILRHDLKSLGLLVWCIAILVSIVLTIDVIIFGSVLVDSTITFPGSNILMSPVVFFSLIIFQTLYFLIESIFMSIKSLRGGHYVADWYFTIYLLILSMNSVAMLIGLLILGYFRTI